MRKTQHMWKINDNNSNHDEEEEVEEVDPLKSHILLCNLIILTFNANGTT